MINANPDMHSTAAPLLPACHGEAAAKLCNDLICAILQINASQSVDCHGLQPMQVPPHVMLASPWAVVAPCKLAQGSCPAFLCFETSAADSTKHTSSPLLDLSHTRLLNSVGKPILQGQQLQHQALPGDLASCWTR